MPHEMMTNGAMLWGMGAVAFLITLLLDLSVVALVKYIFVR